MSLKDKVRNFEGKSMDEASELLIEIYEEGDDWKVYPESDVDFHSHEFISKIYNLFDDKKKVTFKDIEKAFKKEFE